jgi:hypothetical protein
MGRESIICKSFIGSNAFSRDGDISNDRIGYGKCHLQLHRFELNDVIRASSGYREDARGGEDYCRFLLLFRCFVYSTRFIPHPYLHSSAYTALHQTTLMLGQPLSLGRGASALEVGNEILSVGLLLEPSEDHLGSLLSCTV